MGRECWNMPEPPERKKTDEELQEILDELDDNEMHALSMGMLPSRYEGEVSGADVSRLMEMKPGGHL